MDKQTKGPELEFLRLLAGQKPWWLGSQIAERYKDSWKGLVAELETDGLVNRHWFSCSHPMHPPLATDWVLSITSAGRLYLDHYS